MSKQSRHFADVIVLEDFKLHFQGKINLSHKIMAHMGKVNLTVSYVNSATLN